MNTDTSFDDLALPVSASRSIGSQGFDQGVLPRRAAAFTHRGIVGRAVIYSALLAASAATTIGVMSGISV